MEIRADRNDALLPALLSQPEHRVRAPSARAQADADLTARGQAIHVRSHGTYGAPTVKQRRGPRFACSEHFR